MMLSLGVCDTALLSINIKNECCHQAERCLDRVTIAPHAAGVKLTPCAKVAPSASVLLAQKVLPFNKNISKLYGGIKLIINSGLQVSLQLIDPRLFFGLTDRRPAYG